jgi:hypothetical protein
LGGDIKREIHILSKDDDFKTLIYQQGEMWGTMLDFYLQFMLQLEKPTTHKHYCIVHNWTAPILDLVHIDKGNAREKITQWGVKNLYSMNGLENILVFPYNE